MPWADLSMPPWGGEATALPRGFCPERGSYLPAQGIVPGVRPIAFGIRAIIRLAFKGLNSCDRLRLLDSIGASSTVTIIAPSLYSEKPSGAMARER
jgi:hypothetical protein